MTQLKKSNLAVGSAVLGLVMGLVMVGISLASVSADPSSSARASTFPADRNVVGNPSAKVRMVVYFDFQCSHCMNLYFDVESQLIERYVATGKVRLETRPLGFLGPASQRAAMAAMAAADQGRYLDYMAALWRDFRTSGPNAYTDDNLKALASRVGLDRGRFDATYASAAKAAEVKGFESQASSQGVKSVPQTFINGRQIVGEAPLQQFVSVIEQELAK